MSCHEIDHVRRRFFRRHNEIAFVFGVGIISYDYNTAPRDIADDVVNRIELQCLLRLDNHCRYHYVRCRSRQPSFPPDRVFLESRPVRAIKVNPPTWRKSIWRLRACRDNCFRTIHVVIASLKLCFQFHFKLRKIDQIPPDKVPTAIFSGFVLEVDDQMNGVIANLVRRDFRFEIKSAETAVATAKGIKFWIEIKYTRGRKIENRKVRITGAQNFIPGGPRKIPAQPGRGLEQFSQQIFHLTAYFVDARDLLNRTVGRIHSPHRLIKDCTYLLDYALVSSVFSINSQNMFARGVENHLAKCNAAQLSIFVKQPGN